MRYKGRESGLFYRGSGSVGRVSRIWRPHAWHPSRFYRKWNWIERGRKGTAFCSLFPVRSFLACRFETGGRAQPKPKNSTIPKCVLQLHTDPQHTVCMCVSERSLSQACFSDPLQRIQFSCLTASIQIRSLGTLSSFYFYSHSLSVP